MILDAARLSTDERRQVSDWLQRSGINPRFVRSVTLNDDGLWDIATYVIGANGFPQVFLVDGEKQFRTETTRNVSIHGPCPVTPAGGER